MTMPELPEVETLARALAPRLTGARILDARATSHPKWAGAQFARDASTVEISRRGKHILMQLDDGRVLDVHLGMTGAIALLDARARQPLPEPVPHERLLLAMQRGRQCFHFRLTDIRGFGHALLLTRDADGELDLPALRRMGPEPLGDWPVEDFLVTCSRRRTPIKALLLDQSIVAGVGNYLADEALFAARVHPAAPAVDLSTRKLRQLHAAVRDTIAASIANGGASLRNYRQVDGSLGESQEHLLAYGRAGLPCVRCGTLLRKLVVAGRGTTICPRCQRLP